MILHFCCIQAEEHVLDQCAGYAFTSNPTEESVSHVSSCKDDQPPVSVSESSLGAEDGCSGGFEKISADLQGKEAKFSVGDSCS
jgi:hypothetical protein